jgi:hypothetical protein
METNSILAAIDHEIMKLQQARALLTISVTSKPLIVQRGRPKGSTSKKNTPVVSDSVKHKMSVEGKARIASAQKKRWAAVRQSNGRGKAAAVAVKQSSKPSGRPAKSKKAPSTRRVTVSSKMEHEDSSNAL